MAEAKAFANVGREFKRGEAGIAVTEEGLHVKVEFVIPRLPVLRVLVYRRWKRLRGYIENQFFPFGPLTVGAVVVGLVAAVLRSPEDSWLRSGQLATIIWDLFMLLPWMPGLGRYTKIAVVAAWAGVGVFVLVTQLHRIMLKALLAWRGWMYVPRGKKPLSVMAWAGSLKLLLGRKPMTYSFQSSLPALPLPKLGDTVKRYLRSMEPILGEAEYAELSAKAKAFELTEGPRLQRYLGLKWLYAPNYVTDWWLKYCYLRGRSPIAINSNYWALDSATHRVRATQAARAANLVHLSLQYKQLLDNEELRPRVINGLVPLCMDQYKLTFSTTRVPGRECDELKHYEMADSRHIAVLCRGRWFVFDVYEYLVDEETGRVINDAALVPVHAIEAQLERILETVERQEQLESASASGGTATQRAELRVAALTGGGRTEWAVAREAYLSEGANKHSLDAVERAVFVLCLDPEEPKTNLECEYLIAAGNGANRWFDKSFNMIVFKNARAGFNGEHSWADAPTLGHMWEWAMLSGEHQSAGYDAKTGRCAVAGGAAEAKAKAAAVAKAPGALTQLSWDVPAGGGLESAINEAHDTLNKLKDELHLELLTMPYGKGRIKKFKVSPDAFVQMAMQLAYSIDSGGQNCQTYEASMTRFYREGRTETIRSCSSESAAFVSAMMRARGSTSAARIAPARGAEAEAKGAEAEAIPGKAPPTKAELQALLRAAVEKHSMTTRDAMCGKGVDRHLFALYVVSVGRGIESPFLKPVDLHAKYTR